MKSQGVVESWMQVRDNESGPGRCVNTNRSLQHTAPISRKESAMAADSHGIDQTAALIFEVRI